MLETKTLLKQNQSDLLGALASSLCAIHCAVTPVFFIAKPFMHSSAEYHSHGSGFWAILDYVFLVLSFVAIWFSSKHTNHKSIKWIFWGAWLMFSVGLLSEGIHFRNGLWLMYTGSIALVIAHIINYRHCRNYKRESCETD